MSAAIRRVYDDEKHIQFITFSCYKRRRLLDPDRAKRIVIGTLGSQIAMHSGMCIGFVVMPNHVHALLWFDQVRQLSDMMNHWKDQTSLRIKKVLQKDWPEYWSRLPPDDPVWLPRFYPFNVFTDRKLEQKLDYMHMNPVRAGLVEHPCDWPWSSARWYLRGQSVGIPIQVPML